MFWNLTLRICIWIRYAIYSKQTIEFDIGGKYLKKSKETHLRCIQPVPNRYSAVFPRCQPVVKHGGRAMAERTNCRRIRRNGEVSKIVKSSSPDIVFDFVRVDPSMAEFWCRCPRLAYPPRSGLGSVPPPISTTLQGTQMLDTLV